MGRYKLMDAVNGSVCVFGMKESIKKITDMSGILKVVKYCENEADAEGYREVSL